MWVMAKTIFTSISENGDVIIELSQFSSFVDVSKIQYYELITDNELLVVKFYDSDMNILKPTSQNPNL